MPVICPGDLFEVLHTGSQGPARALGEGVQRQVASPSYSSLKGIPHHRGVASTPLPTPHHHHHHRTMAASVSNRLPKSLQGSQILGQFLGIIWLLEKNALAALHKVCSRFR